MADNADDENHALGYAWAILKLSPVLILSWLIAIVCPSFLALTGCVLLHLAYGYAMRSARYRFAQPWFVYSVNNGVALIESLIRVALHYLAQLQN